MKCEWCKAKDATFYSPKYDLYFCNRSHFASWKFYRENYRRPLGIISWLFGRK